MAEVQRICSLSYTFPEIYECELFLRPRSLTLFVTLFVVLLWLCGHGFLHYEFNRTISQWYQSLGNIPEYISCGDKNINVGRL